MSAGPGLDALPDAVVHLDAERRIRSANRATTRVTGFDPRALIGRAWSEVLDARDTDGRPVDSGRWPASTRLRSVRALPEQILTITRGDGRNATLSVTGAYERDRGGRVCGAVLCLRDRAGRPGGSLSGIEIVSTVSHELRSPLTSVKGYTSLLLNRWDRLGDDQKRMMLEAVNHDADRVTRLIAELLDISRLETGRLVLHRQLVDVAVVTAKVVEKVRFEYPELEASTEFATDLPPVWADPDKVEQVLTNLVENACKYASPLGLVLTGVAPPGGPLVVAVADRGEGIPPADLGRVFTKFFRRSEGRPTGSGLGLWISRGLVEAHGGRLTATSQPGVGSTFRFSLPLVDLDRPARP